MADPVLHIKDSYFFEVPKVLWPRKFEKRADVAKVSEVWVELDDQFQDWEFRRQYKALTEDLKVVLPPEEQAKEDWHEWVHHDHANDGKPFDEFLEAKAAEQQAHFEAWKTKQVEAAGKEAGPRRTDALIDASKVNYLQFKQSGEHHPTDYDVFVEKLLTTPDFKKEWTAAKNEAADVGAYVKDTHEAEWSTEKLTGYSHNLAGKILIPQPFGKLRNLHERESGITISKYMLVELGVALIIAILFSWLARRVIAGGAPRGRMWNLLETFVVFIREQIAEPAIGSGHHVDEHDAVGDHGPKRDAHGHVVSDTANAGHGHDAHGPEAPAYDHYRQDQAAAAKKGHAHAHVSPAKKFTPLLCSIFFFVLGCNLAGMLPWIGAPTSAWAVTFAMAVVTFGAVVVSGMAQFGFLGFFINQVPTMDMPWYMGIFLKPAIFLIEFGGLLIKHAVLSVRLLANMVAGHLVLLAIMALAFGAEAASSFTVGDTVSPMWWVAASAAVIGCTLLSLLELFVAFLQAYVFTLLSALFIGAAIHKH
jgi:F-type H+-transporting ATPase subunit a